MRQLSKMIDVLFGVRRENERNRRCYTTAEFTASRDHVDERATRATVTVTEGMDLLELRFDPIYRRAPVRLLVGGFRANDGHS